MNLKIENLKKSFGDQTILNNVNLNIENISSLVIIGPSGGGKSTLLKIIGGLLTPEQGEIEINNQKLLFSEKELNDYRKTIGMVFQAYNLFPHLSALDNILFPLEKVHKISKEEALEKSSELLKKFK
ncbi:MAG: ATP-binding cassette domain-containing protein, partial [Cetobacterium sp.]